MEIISFEKMYQFYGYMLNIPQIINYFNMFFKK